MTREGEGRDRERQREHRKSGVHRETETEMEEEKTEQTIGLHLSHHGCLLKQKADSRDEIEAPSSAQKDFRFIQVSNTERPKAGLITLPKIWNVSSGVMFINIKGKVTFFHLSYVPVPFPA